MNYVKYIVSLLLGALLSYFRLYGFAFTLVGAAVIMDLVTGVLAAVISGGGLSSGKALRGVLKKLSLFAALLFGSLFSALYALAGGLVSLAVMILLKRTDKFSLTAVSAAGGVLHNLAQICVAAAITRTAGIFGYFPVLLLAGLATGIFNGIVCILVLRKLR